MRFLTTSKIGYSSEISSRCPCRHFLASFLRNISVGFVKNHGTSLPKHAACRALRYGAQVVTKNVARNMKNLVQTFRYKKQKKIPKTVARRRPHFPLPAEIGLRTPTRSFRHDAMTHHLPHDAAIDASPPAICGEFMGRDPCGISIRSSFRSGKGTGRLWFDQFWA